MTLEKKSRFQSVGLFVLCAIPGLFLFMMISVILLEQLLAPVAKISRLLIAVTTMNAGMILMLIGIGKWQQWKYLLAFLFLPPAVALYKIAGGDGGKGVTVALFAAALAFIISFWVRSVSRKTERTQDYQ